MKLPSSTRAPFRTVLVSSALILAACQATGPSPESAPSGTAGAPAVAADLVERGRYLATITDCSGCHTPWVMGPEGPAPDLTRLLSGHPEGMTMPPPPQPGDSPWIWQGAGTNTAFAGPWGVSFAINLTPDEATGIGSWTEEIFVNAIRTGKHWGQSRPILPPMPWPAYAQMTDADLKAIYAYLRSVPAIRNQAPDAILAPPPAAH